MTDQEWATVQAVSRLDLQPEGVQNLGQIASLQKADFDRMMQKARPLKDRLNDKVEATTRRVAAVYTQQTQRLSQSALVTKGRELGNSALDTGADLAQGAVGLYEAGREQANAFGRGVKEEAKLFGRDMKEMGKDLRDGAKAIPGDLKAAGKGLADKASRWFKTQKTRVTIASEGARATFAAMKFDATMPQATPPKDLSQLSQQSSQVHSNAPDDRRMHAAQAIATQAQTRFDTQTAARAAGGVAPAGQAVTNGPAQPQSTGQGEQSKPDLTKSSNGKDGIGGR
jgi:hypothetical protein